MSKLYNHKIEKVDLVEFCGPKYPEVISDEGIGLLMRHSYAMSLLGWEFNECGRDEQNPSLFHLHYMQDNRERSSFNT